TVPVVADAEQEQTEFFFLDLTAPDNATIADTRGQGTVIDDDASFVAIRGATVTEGDTGTRDAVFTLNRYGSTAGTSTVEFRSGNFTAVSPEDFAAIVQTVTFAPGDTTKTV